MKINILLSLYMPVIFLKSYVNSIFEVGSYFKYHKVVNLNILVVINAFDNVKRAVKSFSRRL